MTPLLRTLLMALAVGLPQVCAAQILPISEGQAVQAGTMRHVVRSEQVGRDFLVEVTWPPAEILPGARLPVIYALDGGFGVVGPSATLLIAGGNMAPAFVVSVGYPHPMASNFGPRNTDLVHSRLTTPQGQVFGGGGTAFEAFLVEELRPFLEARYPIDSATSYLVGHSGGGLFAANVLAARPELFAGYVIGGTPVNLEPSVVGRVAAAAPRGDGRKVFIFFSPEDKTVSRADELTAPLAAPGSKFEVREKVYESERHLSSYLKFAPDALPFLLPPPARTAPPPITGMVVPAQVLERYVGVYRIDPGLLIAVTRESDKLYVQIANGGPVELIAQSETVFQARGPDTLLAFERGAEPAAKVSLRVRGVSSSGSRVNEPPPPRLR